MGMHKRNTLAILTVIVMSFMLLGVGFSAKPVTGDGYSLDDIYSKLEEVAGSLSALDLKVSSNFSVFEGRFNEVLNGINLINYDDEFISTTTLLNDLDSDIVGLHTKLDMLITAIPVEDGSVDVDGVPDATRSSIELPLYIHKDEIFEMKVVLMDSDDGLIANLEAADFNLSVGEILSVNWSEMDHAYYVHSRVNTAGEVALGIYANRVLLSSLMVNVIDLLIPDPTQCFVYQSTLNELSYELEPESNFFVLRAEIFNSNMMPIEDLTAKDFKLSAGEIMDVIKMVNDTIRPYYLIVGRFEQPGAYNLQLFVNKTLAKDQIIVSCPDLVKPSAELSRVLIDLQNQPVVAGVPYEFEVYVVNEDGIPINNLQPDDFKLSKGEILTMSQLEDEYSNVLVPGRYRIEARIYELGTQEIIIYIDYVKLNQGIIILVEEQQIIEPSLN